MSNDETSIQVKVVQVEVIKESDPLENFDIDITSLEEEEFLTTIKEPHAIELKIADPLMAFEKGHRIYDKNGNSIEKIGEKRIRARKAGQRFGKIISLY